MVDEIFRGRSLPGEFSLPVLGTTPRPDMLDFIVPPTEMVHVEYESSEISGNTVIRRKRAFCYMKFMRNHFLRLG